MPFNFLHIDQWAKNIEARVSKLEADAKANADKLATQAADIPPSNDPQPGHETVPPPGITVTQ